MNSEQSRRLLRATIPSLGVSAFVLSDVCMQAIDANSHAIAGVHQFFGAPRSILARFPRFCWNAAVFANVHWLRYVRPSEVAKIQTSVA